jgi:NADPH-dependent ferric siderophore reductase
VLRNGRDPGTGSELVDTVVALELDGDGWWAFGGAESRQATAVRRHLRRDLGWPAERVSMTGYWRRADRRWAPGSERRGRDRAESRLRVELPR